MNAPRSKKAKDAKSEEEEGGFLSDLPTLAGAVVVALLIRTFLFQSFYVPSESMYPTLLIGDHVFVNKLAYGPRVPTTDRRLPGFRTPERGEVVVFHLARGPGGRIYPADMRPDLPTEAFIKRLIGLPGDTVEVRNGVIHLNGEEVPWVASGETFPDASGRLLDVYEETVGGCRHRLLDDPSQPHLDVKKTTVPDGHFFFMGDNRDNSYDSRRWGVVDLAELEGPAGLMYWSWDWNGTWLSLLNPWTWFVNLTQKTRWSRLGSTVECLPPA